MRGTEFLPVSREEMRARDWYYYDFLVVMADAYIDHPSFGSTLIARLLEAEGYRVAVLAQPDWHDYTAFAEMGKPRFGVFIGGGNLDSMVAHYTVAKRRRDKDLYSPGGKMGYRPDRATIVYANRAREAFGSGTPIIIGGRRRCGALPTTTIGTIRCVGPFSLMHRRTCWCTAWGRRPREKSPDGFPERRR